MRGRGEQSYSVPSWLVSFFFFQAEDGIRDLTVTGVQTCALPISVQLARRRLHFDEALSGRHPHVGQHLSFPHSSLVGAGEKLRLVSRLRSRRQQDRKSVV